MAAQFEGYFEDDNWLRTAAHANAMAQRLAAGIEASDSARLAWDPQANEVFAVLPQASAARLREAGAMFHEWPADDVELAADEVLVRLVTSWATSDEEVALFVSLS
jgi:threonine aldolase